MAFGKGEDRSALPGGKKTGQHAQRASWQQPGHIGPDPGRGRRWRVAGLTFGGALVFGVLLYVVFFLKGPAEIALIAVGPPDLSHATDLSQPLNVFGYKSAVAVRHWADGVGKQPHSWCHVLSTSQGDAPWPLDDEKKEDWIGAVSSAGESTVVIYVGCNGLTTRDGKPALLGRNGDPVALEPLLKRLADVAKNKNKFLVLDVTHIASDWRYGILLNEFAGGLDAVVKQVADPKLYVLCASGKNQRSWESEELGTTAVAHYLIEALSGAPVDGTSTREVKADDVAKYVEREVKKWAERNRAYNNVPFSQHTVAIPSTAPANFIVAYRDQDVSRQVPAKTEVPGTLSSAWAQCDSMAGAQPQPGVYTPRAWRRYRELLLRYQQLAMANESKGAAAVRDACDRLAGEIASRGLPNTDGILTASLVMPAALGRDEPVKGRAVDEMKDWSASGRFTAQDVNGLTSQPLVSQVKFDAQLLHDLRQKKLDLAAFADRLSKADPGGSHRPVEANLPVVVNWLSQVAKERIPHWAVDANLLSLAVDTQMLAERAAVMAPKADEAARAPHPYAERLPVKFAERLSVADHHRRDGEDLLIVAMAQDGKERAATAKRAEQLLNDAAKEFTAVLDGVEPLRRALEVRDHVFADLPFLTRWAAKNSLIDASAADRLVTKLQDTWKIAHELAAKVQALDPLEGTAELTPGLKDLADAVDKGYLAVLDVFTRDVDGLITESATQSTLYRLHAALGVPGPMLPKAKRDELLKKSRSIAYTSLTQAGDIPVDAVNAPTFDKISRYELPLAVAMLGQQLLHEQAGGERGDQPTILAATDPVKGAMLGAHWRHLSEMDNRKDQPSIPQHERHALLAGSGARLSFEPAQVGRVKRWDVVLTRLCERAKLDHWYREGQPNSPQNGPAYSEQQALAFLKARPVSEAQRAERLKEIDTLEKERIARGRLKVECAKDVLITSEDQTSLSYRIEKLPAEFGPGFALTAPVVRPLGEIRLAVGQGPTDWPMSAAQPMQVTLLARGVGTKAIGDVDASVLVFYRGQLRADVNTHVRVNNQPDLEIVRGPAPQGAHVAARAAPDVPLGSVAIILDCSGSMTEKTPTGPTKFEAAIAALKELEKKIPDGTRVGFWVYGHKGELDYDAAEKRSWTDSWNSKNDSLAAQAPKKPLGLTPLILSMMEVVKDPQFLATDDFKTMIVLTDGCDDNGRRPPNTQGGGPMPEHSQSVRAQFERDFVPAAREKNISVQMVLFHSSGSGAAGEADAEIVKRQFPDDQFAGIGNSSERVRATEVNLQRMLLRSILPQVTILNLETKLRETFFAAVGNEALTWFPELDKPPLPQGDYEVSFRRVRKPVHLADGDRLAFLLKRSGIQPDIERHLLAEEPEAVTVRTVNRRNAATKGEFDWILGEYGPQPYPINASRTAVASLEIRPKNQQSLQVERPRFVWWQFRADDEATIPKRSTVTAQLDAEAPAWKLHTDAWPTNDAGKRKPAVVEVWGSNASLEGSAEYRAEGGNVVAGQDPLRGHVAVTSAGFESAKVPQMQGRDANRKYFVVRLNSLDGGYYVPVVDGIKPEAEVHRYYFVGKPGLPPPSPSTSLFLLPASADGRPVAFRVVSVDQLKGADGTVKLDAKWEK